MQRLIRVVAALLLAATLGACAPAPAAAPPTLNFAYPDDAASQAAAEGMQRAFAASNPGVTLALRPLPAAGYAEALGAQLADDDPPDLFAHEAQQVPALRQGDALLDLAPLGVSVADLSPAAAEPWREGGRLLGLPQRAVPTVMFYNRALLDAEGLTIPATGWDWDSWRDAARRLTDEGEGRYGTALSGWDGLVWGNGGEILDAARTRTLLDQPAAAAGVQFGADMVALDRSAPLPPSAGGPDPVALFRAGKLATLPAPSSLIAELQQTPPPFAWAIAPPPAGAVRATRLLVAGIGASARTPHPREAAGFISWAAGRDGLATQVAAFPFAVPPRPDVAPAAMLAGAGPTGGPFVVEALGYGRVQPFVARWPEIAAEVNQALTPVWQGRQSAASAYQQVAPSINSLLTTQ